MQTGRDPRGPAGQGAQRLPHVLGSSSGTQRSPQTWAPPLQTVSQRPIEQAVRPPMGAAHGRSQPPQCRGSLVVSTHVMPQRVGAIGAQPLVHTRTAPPSLGMSAQMGAASGQTAPQRPQFAAAVRSASQPFVGSASQSLRSARQAPSSTQRPRSQRVRPAATPKRLSHAKPQVPQFAVSAPRSRQRPLQRAVPEGQSASGASVAVVTSAAALSSILSGAEDAASPTSMLGTESPTPMGSSEVGVSSVGERSGTEGASREPVSSAASVPGLGVAPDWDPHPWRRAKSRKAVGTKGIRDTVLSLGKASPSGPIPAVLNTTPHKFVSVSPGT